MNLKNEAKGRECTVQIYGVCNHDPETTSLAHLNNKGLFKVGTGQKVPDIFGAWACSACHGVIDGRTLSAWNMSADEVKMLHYEGCFRTQNILLDENKIKT